MTTPPKRPLSALGASCPFLMAFPPPSLFVGRCTVCTRILITCYMRTMCVQRACPSQHHPLMLWHATQRVTFFTGVTWAAALSSSGPTSTCLHLARAFPPSGPCDPRPWSGPEALAAGFTLLSAQCWPKAPSLLESPIVERLFPFFLPT